MAEEAVSGILAEFADLSAELSGDLAILPQLPPSLRSAKAAELTERLRALRTTLDALEEQVPNLQDVAYGAQCLANCRRAVDSLELQLRSPGMQDQGTRGPAVDDEDDADSEAGEEDRAAHTKLISTIAKVKAEVAAMDDHRHLVINDIADNQDRMRSTRREVEEGEAQYARSQELVRLVRRGRLVNLLLTIACSALMALTIALIHWYKEYWA
eukprot:EG_transcript_27920